MATSWLKPLHIGKGRSTSTAIRDIIDYVKNSEKLTMAASLQATNVILA